MMYSTLIWWWGRLARRALWRKRKLWVHARENQAAIAIQCAIRIYLARKKMQRQVAVCGCFIPFDSIIASATYNVGCDRFAGFDVVYAVAVGSVHSRAISSSYQS